MMCWDDITIGGVYQVQRILDSYQCNVGCRGVPICASNYLCRPQDRLLALCDQPLCRPYSYFAIRDSLIFSFSRGRLSSNGVMLHTT